MNGQLNLLIILQMDLVVHEEEVIIIVIVVLQVDIVEILKQVMI